MASEVRDFTIGIEEEYLLVDRVSRDLVHNAPRDVLAACEAAAPGQVTTEFLQSQVEIGTKVCADISEAETDLRRLRRIISENAEGGGLAMIAASTHPFARWDAQKLTEKERYHDLARDLQGVVRRLLICGMHVHVCVVDPDLRVDLMNQVVYFLPHLLALSTSSPFWSGEDTGLASYRLTVFDNLPRTGLPEPFDSWSEYERHVGVLIRTGVIEDSSKIWWDIRPSARFPTLEMRISDVATRVDDAIAIAALFQSLLHMVYRLRRANQRWRRYASMLVRENRWRAQRYGTGEGLIDFGKAELHPYGDLLEEIIELVTPDAEELGCLDQVLATREIVRRGTSSGRQRQAYLDAIAGGAEPQEALRAVVDHLIAESVIGL